MLCAFCHHIGLKVRAIIHAELTIIVLIILCTVLMARGIGFFGG
jgi:uncharacterized membrane protein